ncbi:hypothetical protein HX109_01665 [Galbibacter sp. BG1]|uniref:hypothetical protein n=1 Tax=Galbibacter sp. BG1 TaxID=1170699 RepID=UPI0015BCFF6D|nr:hypothetical protein [Galbibacter sp. BG1]QLE00328.1 hypothetical protein HX109_01665 [Galbibacter sp. BG1]
MKERYKITFTKIIAYYCLFYAAVKIYAIFQGLWLWPNLIIAIFLGITAGIGFYIMKHEKYNWYFVGVCVILLSALRYYEPTLIPYLQQVFGS